jgi:hypothetical protein
VPVGRWEACDRDRPGIIGVPFDGGVTNRTGARHGPRDIRNQSSLIRRINQQRAWRPSSSTAPHVGGGCGPKVGIYPEEFAVALAARESSGQMVEAQNWPKTRTCVSVVAERKTAQSRLEDLPTVGRVPPWVAKLKSPIRIPTSGANSPDLSGIAKRWIKAARRNFERPFPCALHKN